MTDLLIAAPVFARVERGALRRLVHAQELRNSLADYMRWVWPLSHKEPLQWNWHLGAITEHLEACKAGQINRLLVNEPPRHLKSWTASVAFPSWWWADDPAVQFLAGSCDKDVVLRDADAHRDLCASPEYQTMFRPDWNFKASSTGKQQDAKGYYRNTAGGHRVSKVFGKKGQGMDADVLLLDDPLDGADAFSDKVGLVDHVTSYRTRFITRLNNPATGVVILFMQRLHELDLSGIMLEEGGWEHLCLPSEYDGKKRFTILGGYDPRTEEGELLFPERFPQEVLDQKKIDLTARGYAGQYQQMPAPAAGAMVLKDWIQYWTPKTLPEMTYWISSWDCTFGSKTKHADFVVGQVWGVRGNDVYLLDQVRAKMTEPEMAGAIRKMNQLHPGQRAVIIEEAAAGRDVYETLRLEIPGIEKSPVKDKSKEERLAATLTKWEQKHVFLPHPQYCSVNGADYSWVANLYEKELLTFPGSRHDDQVDATSQALIWIRNTGTGEIGIRVIG